MHKNNLLRFSTAISMFVLLTQTVLAAPTIVSDRDQTFDENEPPVQLRNIVITEDADDTFIHEGFLRITIPGSLPIIFDDERTIDDITLFGTAVDNGKIAQNPDVTFEDGDKTLVIPVIGDFAPGEVVNLTKTFVEGFYNQPGSSDHLSMLIEGDVTVYYDTRHLFVRTSEIEDTHDPEEPTNLVVEDNPDGGVKLTWENPTDLDVDVIQILRGKNEPVVGTPYQEVAAAGEEYIDTDVVVGDTVHYILKASDGRNLSQNSEEITFVVGSGTTAEEEDITPETTPETLPEDTDTGETPSEEPAVPSEEPPALFSDVYGHWAESIILGMASRNVIYGNPDGTFNPNGHLNRAEAAALIYRILSPGGDPAAPDEKPFSDVKLNDWFAGYVSEISKIELIKGYKDKSGITTYRPGQNVTRAEFLKMAMNLYYHMGNVQLQGQIDTLRDGETTSEYEDISSDDWYAPDVTAATKLGFVAGSKCEENTCFNPNSDITRAEATKILYEMFFAVSS